MKTAPIKGTIFLSIATAIFMIVGYLINVALGRFLGPSDYGIYGVLISLIAFVNIIQTSGISQTVSKYISETKTDKDSILKTGLLLQCMLSFFFFGIFYFFPHLIAYLLHDTKLIPFIKLCAFIFPLYGIHALFMDYYNGLHHFKKQSFMNIIYSLSKLFIVLGLAYMYKLQGVFLGFIIAPIFSSFYGFELPNLGKPFFSIIKLLRYSLPLISIAIFSNLLLSIDLFIVKAMIPQQEYAGYYTASQNISKIIFFSMTAVFLVLFPSISHAISNNLLEKAKNIIQKSLRIIFLLVCPSVFILSATSRELLELIYSPLYLPATSSLAILFFGIGAFTLFTAMSYILSGSGKPYISTLFSGISLLTSTILCIFLIPHFMLDGAAIATTIGSFLGLLLTSLYIYKHFHVFIPLKSILKILGTSVLLYVISTITTVSLLILPFFYISLFLCYLSILFFLKEFTKEDIALFKSLFPSWIIKKGGK